MKRTFALTSEAAQGSPVISDALFAFRGFCCIGLHRPKTPQNVGAALRAAGCYGADFVAVTGNRFHDAATDTQKAWRHLPLLMCEDLKAVVPVGATPVAVDLIAGATPLQEFRHPERAFYIFGAEDETLDAEVTAWCKHTVYVPTRFCMNLAATVNVILYDRLSKLNANDGGEVVRRADDGKNLEGRKP